jgi:Hemin uptake protein
MLLIMIFNSVWPMLNRPGTTRIHPQGASAGVQNDSQNGVSTSLSSVAGATDGSSRAIRRVSAFDLLGTAREIIITLEENEYHLRLTSKGKLILTK